MHPLDPQRDGEIARWHHGIAEVFGKVVKGYDDVVKKIEDVGSRPWAKVPSKRNQSTKQEHHYLLPAISQL